VEIPWKNPLISTSDSAQGMQEDPSSAHAGKPEAANKIRLSKKEDACAPKLLTTMACKNKR